MTAQFEHLPDVVLQTIFRYLPLSMFDFMGDWKAKLTMPSVCHQWRCATERQLYSNAIIFKPAASSSDSLNSLDKGPPITNVGLIFANRKTSLVKSLCIDWNFCDFELAIHEIIGILRIYDSSGGSSGWINVRELQVLLYPKDMVDRDLPNAISELSLSKTPNKRAELTQLFISNLANITRMTLHSQTYNLPAHRFFSALASAYMHQLCELKSSEKLRFEIQNRFFSSQLNTLYAVMNNESQLMPLVNADSIEDLLLSNLPMDFELLQYVCAPNDSVVVFANLKRMELLLAQDSWRNNLSSSFTARVHFPKLEHLTIRGCVDSNRTMLGNIAGDNRLKSLTFAGAFSVLKEICKTPMSEVETLTITLEVGSTFNASEFALVTNMLFENTKENNMSTLTLSQCAFDLDNHSISWNNLHYLIVHCPISFDTVSRLLAHTPNVSFLDVSKLVLDRDYDIGDELEFDIEHARANAYDSLINTMLVEFDHDYSTKNMVYAVVYLVLRLSNLGILHVDSRALQPVMDFFETKLYPIDLFKAVMFI